MLSSKNTILDGSLAPGDVAVANTQIIVGNASGVGAAVAMSGDATIANTGAVTIAATSVEASMLGANLAKGYINLPLTTAIEIASNATQNLAAHGGKLASDSTPILERVNGATDKALRLTWAAADVAELQFAPVPKPPDFDDTTDFTVHLMTAKDADANTVTIDVQFWDGVGDTEAGGATGTIAQTLAENTVTIANANVAAAPSVFNISLVPSAHAGDALYLYGAWIEYARKT